MYTVDACNDIQESVLCEQYIRKLSKFFTTKFHVITGTNNYTRSVLI